MGHVSSEMGDPSLGGLSGVREPEGLLLTDGHVDMPDSIAVLVPVSCALSLGDDIADQLTIQNPH